MAGRFVIATWNVNSIRSRIDIVTGWLKKNSPDVLCMQETKVTDDKFPAAPFNDIGYHVVFSGEKSYNGVAIASREKPENVASGLDVGKELDAARLIRAKIAGIEIVNTYVPQGRDVDSPMFPYKLKWFSRLREFFANHYTPKSKLVWVGDLNVAPTPDDVYDPKGLLGHVCFRPDVTAAFEKVLEWGFVDVFRKHHPEARQYTFFDYRVKDAISRKMGWRVDHILATKPLAGKSVRADIDMSPRLLPKASDHTVMLAEFAL